MRTKGSLNAPGQVRATVQWLRQAETVEPSRWHVFVEDGLALRHRGVDILLAPQQVGTNSVEALLANGWDNAEQADARLAALAEALNAPQTERVVAEIDRCSALLLETDVDWMTTNGSGWCSRWRPAARLIEALWPVYEQRAEHSLGLRMRLPLVARARFLILSAPFRGDVPQSSWPEIEATFGDLGRLSQRARLAREAWADELLSYQDRPAIDRLGPRDLENEGRLLTTHDTSWRGSHLALQRPSDARDPHEERAATERMLRRFYLPRFMLADVASVVWRSMGGWGRAAIAGAVLMLVVGAFALPLAAMLNTSGPAWTRPVGGLPGAAAILGAVGYFIVVIHLLVHGPSVAYPFLLRFPAGVAIGLAALLSLQDFDYRAHSAAGAGVVVIAVLYLMVEARNHGVALWPSVRRGLATGLIGLVHGLVLSAAAVAAALPALSNYPPVGLRGAAIAQVLLAAGGLTLGVFLQVLWEDRPVTYPLAHMEWTDRS